MSTTRIQTKISKIFSRHFLIPGSMLQRTKKLQDLGLNIMEQMEVMLYLESEFGINLTDRDVAQIKTYGDTIACVERYTAGRA